MSSARSRPSNRPPPRASGTSGTRRAPARASSATLTLVLETVTDGVLAVDREWRVTYANAAAERMLGRARDELLGAELWALCPELSATALGPACRRAADERAVVVVEDRYEPLGGWLEARVHPTDDGVVIVARDVSERHRLAEAERERERLLAAEQAARREAEAQRDRFRLINRATSDVVWDWDLATDRIERSAAVEAVFRYPLAEVGADPQWWLTRMHPDDRARVTRELRDALAGSSETWVSEYRVLRADGAWAAVLDRGYIAREPTTGRAVRVVGAMLDLSARKDAEHARLTLLARERLARAAAEAIAQRQRFLAEAGSVLASSLDYRTTLAAVARLAVPFLADGCAVDMVDADGSFRRLASAHVATGEHDEAWARWERCRPTRDDAFGNARVVGSGEPELLADVTDAALEAGVRDPVLRATLRELGLRSSLCVPLRARDQVIGTLWLVTAPSGRRFAPEDLAVAEDLAQRAAVAIDNARLYDAAQRERVRAEEANRAKDAFLATISHELRTPLNAILGWARMLRAGTLRETRRDHALEAIERNASAQARLVEDLLDISRVEAGRVRLELAPVDIVTVVTAALDAVRPPAEAKGVRLAARLAAAGTHVSGDADRLQQVVWNLLSNAVKFTPRGGRVEVVVAPRAGLLELAVRDSGQGIHPAFLPHVFERFRQADASTTRAHGGLGLGLAIAKHLVELHGGTIVAQSDGEGHGATFVVRLPTSPTAT